MKEQVGMEKNLSYTTEEVANILKVSKLTVYDLVKKGYYLLIVSDDKCELILPI